MQELTALAFLSFNGYQGSAISFSFQSLRGKNKNSHKMNFVLISDHNHVAPLRCRTWMIPAYA